MKCKQLRKRAKDLGWYLIRYGGRHEVWGHAKSKKHVTIPYNAKDYVGKLILRQLNNMNIIDFDCAISHRNPS